MITGQITAGEVVKHKETGRRYVVFTLGRMRTGKDTWVSAVTYRTTNGPLNVFTRDEASFNESFQRSTW